MSNNLFCNANGLSTFVALPFFMSAFLCMLYTAEMTSFEFPQFYVQEVGGWVSRFLRRHVWNLPALPNPFCFMFPSNVMDLFSCMQVWPWIFYILHPSGQMDGQWTPIQLRKRRCPFSVSDVLCIFSYSCFRICTIYIYGFYFYVAIASRVFWTSDVCETNAFVTSFMARSFFISTHER